MSKIPRCLGFILGLILISLLASVPLQAKPSSGAGDPVCRVQSHLEDANSAIGRPVTFVLELTSTSSAFLPPSANQVAQALGEAVVQSTDDAHQEAGTSQGAPAQSPSAPASPEPKKDSSASWQPVIPEIISAVQQPLESQGADSRWIYKIKFVLWQPGQALIQPWAVPSANGLPSGALTQELALTVQQPPTEPQGQLAVEGALLKAEYNWRLWLGALALCALLCGAGYAFYTLYWEKRRQRSPQLQGKALALDELSRLDAAAHSEQNSPRETLDELQRILRTYLGWAFEPSLANLTAAEAERTVSAEHSEAIAPFIKEWKSLEETRYMGASLTAEEARQYLTRVKELIEQ